MNKVTIGALVAVVILGVVVFFLSRDDTKADFKTLEIPALKLPEKPKQDGEEAKEKEVTAEEKAAEAAKVGPADRIVIVHKDLDAVLERVSDEEWKLIKPMDALADTYKVRGMLRTFDEALKSNYSRAVAPEALAKLGLDEENRIRVTMSKGDETLVDLFIGRVDRKDDSGIDMDTMVMLPADLESPVYYRIPGKDLRRSFDLKLSELRDKKVFGFNKDDVTAITIVDPRKNGGTLKLKRGEGADDWAMVEPAGLEVENLSGYVSTLATARAEEFMEKLPGADATALDKAYRITATYKEGDASKEVTLELGAGRKKGVYARLAGKPGYFLVPRYSAEQLMKGGTEFRRKKLFTFQADDIEEITIAETGKAPVQVRRSGGGWAFVQPTGLAADAGKLKSLTTGLANFRVAEFLSTAPATTDSGLGGDAARVTVKLGASAGGGVTKLLIGKSFKNDKDQDRIYAQVEGESDVFTIMRYSVDNVLKTADDLKDKRLFLVSKDEINHVTLTHPDQTLEFERSGADWKMTAPKVIEKADLAQLVSTLADLDVEGTATDKTPAEAGIGTDSFTITFKTTGGATHAVTISEEVKENANYATTSTNADYANQLLLISKYKVDNLTKKLPDFEG